jgi:hypothetical protein
MARRPTAKSLDKELRAQARTVADSLLRFKALVERAKASEIHRELGFPSWPAYIADVVSTEMGQLHRDDRLKVEALLLAEGMSTNAVAAAVGVDPMTVHRDRGQMQRNAIKLPSTVTTLDGRSYPAQRSAPPPPPPPPTPDELLEDLLGRFQERARGAVRDLRQLMADLSDASNDTAGWVCLEMLNLSGEMRDVADEFFEWYGTVLDRWAAEEGADA